MADIPYLDYPLMEVYLDYIEGLDSLTWQAIERLESEFVMSFKFSAFPRRPMSWTEINKEEMKIHGLDLEGLLKMREDLRRTVEEMGSKLGMHSWRVDIRLAQELAKWAESIGRGREMHKLLDNVTMHSKDLGNIDVLIDVVAERHFDAREARRALESGAFAPLVDADWEKAKRFGIDHAPAYIIEGFMMVGHQRYESLSELVGRFAKRKTKAAGVSQPPRTPRGRPDPQ